MKIINTLVKLRQTLAPHNDIAFVPTMGNLHAGHLALVKQAREHAKTVVVSIFVNPLQFGENEDFSDYPRTLQADAEKLENLADVIFAPSAEEIYPHPLTETTQVIVPQLGDILCGASRHGHFNGVTTVVAKLFNMVQPQVALFGQKDYQQLTIIKRMVADLALPINIISIPIYRENDGLAMSSRNGYLTAKHRQIAPEFYRSLQAIQQAVKAGDTDYRQLEQQAQQRLIQHGFAPEYISVRDAQTLNEAQADNKNPILLAVARLGTTRLLDNIRL